MLLPKIFYDSENLPLSYDQMVVFSGREILALQEISHILDYEKIWVDVEDWKQLSQSIQYKLLNGESMTDLSDAILNGLNNIAEHLKDVSIQQTNNQRVSSGCCEEQQNSGQDVRENGGTQYYPPTTPPPDYQGTPEEYDASRCYGAQIIVDTVAAVAQAASDVVNLPTLSVVQLGSVIANYLLGAEFIAGTGVVIAGTTVVLTVPELIVMVAAIAVWNFTVDASLQFIADTVNNNREEYVCKLYNAASSSDAVDWVMDVIANAIALEDLSVSQSVVFQALFSYFLGGDYLNRYMDGSYDPTSAVDCSTCNNDPNLLFESYYDWSQHETMYGEYNGTTVIRNNADNESQYPKPYQFIGDYVSGEAINVTIPSTYNGRDIVVQLAAADTPQYTHQVTIELDGGLKWKVNLTNDLQSWVVSLPANDANHVLGMRANGFPARQSVGAIVVRVRELQQG